MSDSGTPTPTLAYDFRSFFEKHNPGVDYSFSRCSGGLVNLTVRAKRVDALSRAAVSDDSEEGSSPRSFIVKYAPPYIAALGPSAPFSQHRQNIEAFSLGLFNPDGALNYISTLSGSGSESSNILIRIPRLYIFSPEDHIIVMEDLGSGDNLEDWVQSQDVGASSIRDVGERIGRFMGYIHSHPTHDLDQAMFRRDPSNNTTAAFVVDTMPGYLREFGFTETETNEKLYRRIRSLYMRTDSSSGDLPDAFSIGDFWPYSFLIRGDHCTTTEGGSVGNINIGIIDWEFAGFAPPMQDIAQLAAHLHQLLHSSSEPVRSNVKTLIHSIHQSYRLASRSRARAQSQPDLDAESPSWTQSVSKQYFATIRAAWILHGRELINTAAERDWPNCIPMNGDGVDHMSCPKRREMARLGAWYVDVASDDVEEMKSRWEEVVKEEVLRPLYLE